MVHDDDSVAEHSPEPRRGSKAGRALLFTGVAGACALGAGLGLWARPSDIEQPATARPAAAAVTPVSAPRRIPIVVDDTPAPIGKPLDVLAPSPARPAIAPPQAPEMMAPSRPPNGLVRVAAPVPGPIESARPRTLLPPISPPPGLAPAVRPAPADARLRAAQLAAEQQRALAAQKAAQTAAEQARAQELAQRQARQAASEKLAQAKAAKAEHARELAEARQEAKAERLAELKARRDRARAAELAKLALPPKPKHGLNALIAKFAPHHESREAAERAEAKADRKAELKKARLAKQEPKAAPRPRAEPPLMAPKGGGPIRIANTRCASPDPGEALACGDPSLSAAERRLARAYRDAEAAGVPAATLAQQQQRWKQARAAAAREAPWAVRDVYQARIAELQDMTRDAQGN